MSPPDRIDWAEAHRRLEAARQLMERGGSLSPEETRALLRRRAAALARKQQSTKDEARGRLDVVAFFLGREEYGIEAEFVSEVLPLKDLTPLPCTPRFVLGIVTMRGRIVSVIDIRKLYDLPEAGLSDLDQLIVIEGPGMQFGILANRLSGLVSVPLDDVQPAPPTLTGARETFLRGVTPAHMIILDVGRMLSDSTIVVRQEVRAAEWKDA